MSPRGLDLEHVCRTLGLGPPWGPVLERHLPVPSQGGRWSTEAVDAWRHQRLAKFDTLTVSDVRAVAEAARRQSNTPVRGRRAPHLHSLALTVAVAMTGDDAGWRGRRGLTGQQLVAHGLPTPQSARAVAEDKFGELWRAGASRDDIADTLGLATAATERIAKSAAPRWGYLDVTRALGWSPDNLRLRRHTGTFPDPDGTDRTRPWWWPDTIWSWVERSNLTQCPECGALVARLVQHRRAHLNEAARNNPTG